MNSRCFHIKEREILDEREYDLSNKLFGKLGTVRESNLKYCADLSEYERLEVANDEIRNNLCCLIPFLDFMNHSCAPNSFAHFDEARKVFTIKSQVSDTDELDNEQAGLE